MSNEKSSKLSIEELMAMASHQPEKEITPPQKLNDIHRFILALGIQTGDHPVPASLIYEHYIDWLNGRKMKPSRIFFRQFKNFFPDRIRRQHTRYYLLDPAPFDFSDAMQLRVRKRLRREYDQNPKTIHKKNKEKTAKTE